MARFWFTTIWAGILIACVAFWVQVGHLIGQVPQLLSQ